MRRLVGGVAALGAGLGLAGCAQILGYQDIPDATPDAESPHEAEAHEGGRRDSTVDGMDARNATDSGREAATGCGEIGATRCSANGRGTETCEADGRGPVALCEAGLCYGGTCGCLPGATRCVGQSFEQCGPGLDAGLDAAAPTWGDGVPCDSGLCSLVGCEEPPPSCTTALVHGVSTCQLPDGGAQSCCTSNEVPGGSFDLAYVGLSPDNDQDYKATVSAFRLDRFEVTVGRFRGFLAAISADAGSWRPPSGSGKHTHVNAGRGLVDRAAEGGVAYETG